jgi:DNA-binding transcriptional LysR family regulator
MSAIVGRDLNDVEVFIKVVECRSFTAAAKLLGAPNSTISRRVSRLEEQLGVRLLQRTTRKLSLTDAGQLYYDRSVVALSGLEEAESMLADAQSTPKGRVRVRAPIEHTITMRLVTEFIDQYPEVRVDLELTSRDVNIIEEGFDASIEAGPITNLSVVAHKLFDSPFRIVASPAYLDRNGTPTTIADLADHDCIIVGPASSRGHWSLAAGAEAARVPVRGRIAVNNMQAVRTAVISGLGIGLLPVLACGGDIREERVQVVLDGFEPPPVPLYVTYAGRKYLAPAVRAFVDLAKARFSELAAA